MSIVTRLSKFELLRSTNSRNHVSAALYSIFEQHAQRSEEAVPKVTVASSYKPSSDYLSVTASN